MGLFSIKTKKVLAALFATVAFVLECLPWGAVLNFANPDGDSFRQTFSYFSLVPFGYANFSPLFTAYLTAILVLFSFLNLFFKKKKYENISFFLSVGAFLLSICHLLYGFRYFSWTGFAISLCLGVCILVLWKREH